jgi:hypothetical protein
MKNLNPLSPVNQMVGTGCNTFSSYPLLFMHSTNSGVLTMSVVSCSPDIQRTMNQMIKLSIASGTHRKPPTVVGAIAVVAAAPGHAAAAVVEEPGASGTFSFP